MGREGSLSETLPSPSPSRLRAGSGKINGLN
jgi:hypothetical protein